jgi:hypothetical protein
MNTQSGVPITQYRNATSRPQPRRRISATATSAASIAMPRRSANAFASDPPNAWIPSTAKGGTSTSKSR